MALLKAMRPVAVAVFLLPVLAIVIHRVASEPLTLAQDDQSSSLADDHPLCSRSDPGMDPFHEIRHGQDVVWQIPPNPKAVIFMAHGMGKEPLSYFDPGPHCRLCYGYPEDRAVVLEALNRSYAVIAVKSVGSYWLPWSVETWPPPSSRDRVVVTSVIREWTREHSVDHLPLAAFGHSSGGNFSTLLTVDLDIKSLILMCTPGEFEVLEHANATFPPTLFVPMPFDNGPFGFYPMILKAFAVLKAKGLQVREVDAWPAPIYPHFFNLKIPCLGDATSEKIYAAYKAEGWLADDDYLIKNPRLFDWEAVLRKHRCLPFCNCWKDLCMAKHVKQELMTAYAEHSLTSGTNELVYDWLDHTLFPGTSLPARLTTSM